MLEVQKAVTCAEGLYEYLTTKNPDTGRLPGVRYITNGLRVAILTGPSQGFIKKDNTLFKFTFKQDGEGVYIARLVVIERLSKDSGTTVETQYNERYLKSQEKVEVSDHKEPDVPTFEEWKKHYTSLPLEQRTEALWAAHYRLKLVNINELARPAGK